MSDDVKAKLFSRKAMLEIDKVQIGDVHLMVRALSREEVKTIREAKASASTFENRLIAAALLDPVMTPSEVAEWLDEAPAGDSVTIMTAISKLSGLDEGADKSVVRGNGKRRRN